MRPRVPSAGPHPSLAPGEFPTGIAGLSCSKSNLREQGSHLNSPNNWPPSGPALGIFHYGDPEGHSLFRPPSPPGLQLEGWVGWGRYLLSKGPSTNLDLEPGGEQETVRGDRSQPKALCAEESERSGWAVVRHQKRPPSKEVTSRVAPRGPGYSMLGQLKAALPWAGAPGDDLGLREHLFLRSWVGSLVIACSALSRTQGEIQEETHPRTGRPGDGGHWALTMLITLPRPRWHLPALPGPSKALALVPVARPNARPLPKQLAGGSLPCSAFELVCRPQGMLLTHVGLRQKKGGTGHPGPFLICASLATPTAHSGSLPDSPAPWVSDSGTSMGVDNSPSDPGRHSCSL